MEFKSYKAEALAALKSSKHEVCQRVGVLAQGEAKSLCPVGKKSEGDPHPGNLKKSIVPDILPDDSGVAIGVTPDAPYGLTIEKGLNNHRAQPYLEPGAMNAIPKIENVVKQVYGRKMGG